MMTTPLRYAGLFIAVLVALPLLAVILSWLTPDSSVWHHLWQTQLATLITNTLILVFGVGFGVVFVGVGLAWLVVMCRFPGRGLFEWALMLPLAVPAYVLAFAVLGTVDYGSPIDQWFQSYGMFPLQWVRSPLGVVGVLTMAFYPYVYMLARSAFLAQSRNTLEISRSLGCSIWGAFFKVALPQARPAIVAGLSLALMETLADFGAVSVLGYQTFTTAIYKTWFGLFNLNVAAQLASLLLLGVFLALLSERKMRRSARYYTEGVKQGQHSLLLSGAKRWAAVAFCSVILCLAFVFPVVQLIWWALQALSEESVGMYWRLLEHTLVLGVSAAILVVLMALLLAYLKKHYQDWLVKLSVQVATLGYALPGSVLAVGVMLSFSAVEQQVNRWVESWGGEAPGLFLTGTVGALLFAYLVRFMAVAFGAVDSALEKIKPTLFDAARTLGGTQWVILWRVVLPIMRPGVLTALLLVLVDVMKEMPATLLLRPFGWDTLAVHIFELTS
jgi:iron(III) transport system permease protein